MVVDNRTSNKIRNMGFVCTVMVVLIHVPQMFACSGTSVKYASSILSNGVCRLAVPYFFLVSGYFLAMHMRNSCWWNDAIWKRIASLLIPAFIFGTFYILFDDIARMLTNIVHLNNIIDGVCISRDQMIKIVTMDAFGSGAIGPVWYMRTLFFLVVISPIVKWTVDRKWGVATILCFMLLHALIFPYPYEGFVPYSYWHRMLIMGFVSILGLFWFTLGVWIGRRGIRLDTPIVIGLGSLVVGLALFAFRGWCVFHGGNLLTNCYLGFIAIPFVILGIWRIIPCKGWPKFLTSSSIAIYLMHIFVLKAIAIKIHSVTAFSYIVVACVAIAIPIVFSQILRASMPRLAHLVFGGR